MKVLLAEIPLQIIEQVPSSACITSNGEIPTFQDIFEGVEYPFFIRIKDQYGCEIDNVMIDSSTTQVSASNGTVVNTTENIFFDSCFKGSFVRGEFVLNDLVSAMQVETIDDCGDSCFKDCYEPVSAVLTSTVTVSGITLQALSDEIRVNPSPSITPYTCKFVGVAQNLYDYYVQTDTTGILNREFVDGEIPFQTYLQAIYGDNGIGDGVINEIARFADNRSDVDTQGIIYLCDNLNFFGSDVPAVGLGTTPDNILTMLDKFSVSYDRLFGTLDDYEMRFRLDEACPGTDFINNGRLLTITDTVSAGDQVVVNQRGTDFFFVVHVTPLSGVAEYPLSAMESGCLAQPLFDNYCFFEHVTQEGERICNLIDFDSENTLLKDSVGPEDFSDLEEREFLRELTRVLC